MKPLTQCQQNVLTYIKRCVLEQGYPPTVRELAIHFQCQPNVIYRHRRGLIECGALRKAGNGSKGIVLVEATR